VCGGDEEDVRIVEKIEKGKVNIVKLE